MLDVTDEVVSSVTGQVGRAEVEVAASGSVQAGLLLAVTGVGQGGAVLAQTGGQAGHVEDQVNTRHSSSTPALHTEWRRSKHSFFLLLVSLT